MAFIISADEIKKTLPGYDPEKAELFHKESAKLADKTFAKAVKERPERKVILMSGGTASGKSEYVSEYLKDTEAIVFDGTLPTFGGAKIKINAGLKAGKKVEVHAVLPANFLVAFIAFLNRDRKFAVEHFYRTHSSSRKTLLEIARHFPDLPFRIFISNVDFIGEGAQMSFKEATPKDHSALIEFLQNNQYTQDEVRKMTHRYDV